MGQVRGSYSAVFFLRRRLPTKISASKVKNKIKKFIVIKTVSLFTSHKVQRNYDSENSQTIEGRSSDFQGKMPALLCFFDEKF